MNDAIVVRGLTKRYGARTVLRGLDLQVRQGELFALLGMNGAGKTTALECIEGLRRYDAGTITVDGRLGIQLQSASLPEHIRPMEAVRLVAGWNRTEIDETMLEDLGIPALGKRPMPSCPPGRSGGSIWPSPCFGTRTSWCWTNPPRGWTWRPGWLSTCRSRDSGPRAGPFCWPATIWRRWSACATAWPF